MSYFRAKILGLISKICVLFNSFREAWSSMVVNILSFWGWLWRVNRLRLEVKNRLVDLKRNAQTSLPEVGERTSFSWKKSTGCVNAKQTRDFIHLQNDKVSTFWIFVFFLSDVTISKKLVLIECEYPTIDLE